MDPDYAIYDGAHVETNCTDINKAQFSYNNGVYLLGAAYMWNHVRTPLGCTAASSYTNSPQTQDPKWEQRLTKLVDATLATFFPDNIAYEIACEEHMTCTTDMLSFKGYIHRWLATATRLAPFIRDKVLPILQTSTNAAVAQCTGGSNGRTCGFRWSSKTFDGSVGAGQTMNVLGAVSSLLINSVSGPLTNETGGTSPGDFNAGGRSDDFKRHYAPITVGDKAGASVLTLLVVIGATATFGWMSSAMGEKLPKID